MGDTTQGNGGQGQESAAGNQGQGQESASQQGQQNPQGNQSGQESGQSGQGGQGPADISTMSEGDLRTYAARLQQDAQEARQQAANYRTQHQSAQQQLTEAQRAQMTEQERIQADLQQAQSAVQERDSQLQALQAQVEDLTRGAAVRTALASAGALNPATAFKVGTWEGVKVGADGTVEEKSFTEAIQALKQSDPYLFKRTANADAGAGGGAGSSPEGGSSINDFLRGRTGR